MDPTFANAHWQLGWCYIGMKEFPKALEAFKKADELFEKIPASLSGLAYAYALLGEREKARKLLDEIKTISEEMPFDKVLIAIIYGALGERDRAFELLREAYENRKELLTKP